MKTHNRIEIDCSGKYAIIHLVMKYQFTLSSYSPWISYNEFISKIVNEILYTKQIVNKNSLTWTILVMLRKK